MFQAANHEFCQNDHASSPYASTAVDDNRRVAVVAAVQNTVGVAAHRLNLFQISCKVGIKMEIISLPIPHPLEICINGDKCMEKYISI